MLTPSQAVSSKKKKHNNRKRQAKTKTQQPIHTVLTCNLVPSQIASLALKAQKQSNGELEKSSFAGIATMLSNFESPDAKLQPRQQNGEQSREPFETTGLITALADNLAGSHNDVFNIGTNASSNTTSTVTDAVNQRKRSRKPRPKKKKRSVAPVVVTAAAELGNSTSSGVAASTESIAKPKASFPLAGDLPDVHWRAVPMDHLRSHPRFVPLPLPQEVTASMLQSLDDVRIFRQDSWQWDALHRGRCTTSQAAAALGFLEPSAGSLLNVHSSWLRGGRGAYQRLSQKTTRTLLEMQETLIEHDKNVQYNKDHSLWKEENTQNHDSNSKVATYTYITPKSVLDMRRARVKGLAKQGDELERSIRLKWGNTQEATSLLTALNYFSNNHNTTNTATNGQSVVYMHEVGMCGAGLQLNTSQCSSSLLVGATPDAVFSYPDGTIEAVEVKNHCPFVSNRFRKFKNKGGKHKRFVVSDRPIDEGNGVFAQYVSQLQLEMLCLGPHCKSAVMVRQTATQGALILRMKRNDEWIEEMLYWLHQFQSQFVEKHKPPPVDFFWTNSENKEMQSRYRRFVNDTIRLRNSTSVVARIPADQIQRVEMEMSMFLD